MDINVSIEDICGKDKIKAMREKDKKYSPNVSWFSNMDPDRLNTYMAKYPFDTFDSIPEDHSGLIFPSFEQINFTFPPIYSSKSAKIVYVEGLLLLKNLGSGAFCIDPRRWHKIKTYISKGNVEYPEASINKFGVLDGRHRTLLLMQLYNRQTVPVVVPYDIYDKFIDYATDCGAI